MRPANERLRYNVTSSLISCMHAQNDPCKGTVTVLSKFLYIRYTLALDERQLNLIKLFEMKLDSYYFSDIF